MCAWDKLEDSLKQLSFVQPINKLGISWSRGPADPQHQHAVFPLPHHLKYPNNTPHQYNLYSAQLKQDKK